MKSLTALFTLLALTVSSAHLSAEDGNQLRREDPLVHITDPDLALKKLIAGNARYAAGEPLQLGRASEARTKTGSTQKPFAIILSCADSRVAPEVLFDQGIGDVFVVRVAGNTLTDYGLASIEYAVAVLGSPLIFVMGHSGCGAVDAAVKTVNDDASFPGHIDQLVDKIEPPVEALKAENANFTLEEAVNENVRYVMELVNQANPIVAEAIKDGKVKVAGGVYHLENGTVDLIN